VNLCITSSRTLHLILTCEICHSRIGQCILDSLRMVIVACYLVSGSSVSFVHDFSSVIVLFSSTLISGM
jgi:hypothetical protein